MTEQWSRDLFVWVHYWSVRGSSSHCWHRH